MVVDGVGVSVGVGVGVYPGEKSVGIMSGDGGRVVHIVVVRFSK